MGGSARRDRLAAQPLPALGYLGAPFSDPKAHPWRTEARRAIKDRWACLLLSLGSVASVDGAALRFGSRPSIRGSGCVRGGTNVGPKDQLRQTSRKDIGP